MYVCGQMTTKECNSTGENSINKAIDIPNQNCKKSDPD